MTDLTVRDARFLFLAPQRAADDGGPSRVVWAERWRPPALSPAR